jgi:transcriptional regulator with XRE-family HTH domain
MTQKLVNMSVYASRLREERKRLGLSLGVLAAAGGVAAQTLIGYEKGARKPDMEFLSGVMAVGVDISFLMSGKRAAARVEEDVDWVLLDKIYEGLDLACRENSVQVKAGKRSELVRVLYALFVAEQRVDPDTLRRVLTLAA